MTISPFTPLRFDDGTKSDGVKSRYVQVFAPTDRIMLQVFTGVGTNEGVPVGKIYDAHTDELPDRNAASRRRYHRI